MHTINVDLANNAYPVYLGRNLLSDGNLWRRHLGDGSILVVSNETVAPLYLEKLTSGLAGRAATVHILPDGEQHKTVETWYGIIDALVGMQARRDACVIALGGGVVGANAAKEKTYPSFLPDFIFIGRAPVVNLENRLFL